MKHSLRIPMALVLVALAGPAYGQAPRTVRPRSRQVVPDDLPDRHPADCYDPQGDVAPCMIRVPSGTFIMGDGLVFCGMDEHEVTLTRDFWLAQYEVTNAEYLVLLQWAYDQGYVTATDSLLLDNTGGSTEQLLDMDDIDCEIGFSEGVFYLRDAGHGINPDHPVKEVTWYGAATYCDWLSLRTGLKPAYDHATWACGDGDPYTSEGYRLPTDAEWEYAAQWDDERIYPWGNEAPQECIHANYAGCIGWTAPVGSFPAGAQRSLSSPIYDLAGNSWEWCNDWLECDLGTWPRTDPSGPANGIARVRKTSCWGLTGSSLHVASRSGTVPQGGSSNGSFRIARTAVP